jgi:cytochrome c peroxidase
MRALEMEAMVLGSFFAAALAGGCAGREPTGASQPEGVEVNHSALTVSQRLANCNQDVRVIAGLVSANICAGADIFFRETFNGNGRTCGSCHDVANNFTIDPTSIQALHASNPNDPLFVAETNPNLAGLEDPTRMLSSGLILENVDGFEDATHKFVMRSVPHTLSLATSIAADPLDTATTNPPVERTGWDGGGAPGDGSLRQFLAGAIKQHYTKDLRRREGTDFRVATSQELDLVLAFQLALGRTNELDLTQVRMFDANAEQGRQIFMDPVQGRCNICHTNAGANFIDTGKNRNFDTGTRLQPGSSQGGFYLNKQMFDGGFGGQGLANYNFESFPLGQGPNSFGNGTFNTPPLIEAADTGPFFHTNNQSGSIENAIFFYAGEGSAFHASPAGQALEAQFGNVLEIPTTPGFQMGRFLRGLNIALNMDMAKQRLRAALTLANRFGDTGVAVQLKLLTLGQAEIDDALAVLTDPIILQVLPDPYYPVAIDRLNLAKQEIAAAQAAPVSSRAGHISNAVSRVENARDTIGSNITFTLGTGNLMF